MQDYSFDTELEEYFEIDEIMKEIEEENWLLTIIPKFDRYGFAVV